MKKLNSLLLMVVLAFASLGLNAQTDQGFIKLEVTDVSADDEQMAAQLEMMKGTEVEVHFMGEKSVTVMNMMGGMIQMKNMLDEEGNLNIFMDAMGQKTHVKSSKSERDLKKAETANPMDDLTYAYDEKDRKEIMGHDCYKMTATAPGSDSPVVSAYVTKDIKVQANVEVNTEGYKTMTFEEFSTQMGGGFGF